MKNRILAMALMVMAFPGGALAQTKSAIVGTWKLLSATDTTEQGETKDGFGPNPAGFITYTADGRMMVLITFGGRKALSVGDFVAAPAAERAQAFATMLAYAGRYSFAGDKVTHHIEAAWMQNLVNTDQVRYVKVQSDRLTLRTSPYWKGGTKVTSELIWERMKPETTRP